MSNVEIEYHVSNRYDPNGLLVSEELVGIEHMFCFDDTNITIKLPGMEHYKDHDENAKVTSWLKSGVVGGEMKPVFYSINCMYIKVYKGGTVSVKEEVLKTNANIYEYIDEPKRSQLNKIASEAETIADEFFDYFSKAARWSIDSPDICRDRVVSQKSRLGPRLISNNEDRTIWIGRDLFFKFGGEPILDTVAWEKITGLIASNRSLPIYIDLFLDAQYHVQRKDIKRCISDLSVSCETCIRQMVSERLPDELDNAIVEIIDSHNIRPIINKVVPNFLAEKEKKAFSKIKSKLNALFDLRNDLFHSGVIQVITTKQCEDYIDVIRRLIEIKQDRSQ